MAACAVMAGGILALTSKSYFKRASRYGSSSSSSSSSSYSGYSSYYNNYYDKDIGVITAAAAGLAAGEL